MLLDFHGINWVVCRISPDMRGFSDWMNMHTPLNLPPKLNIYPKVGQMALPKPASDHCPILLESRKE